MTKVNINGHSHQVEIEHDGELTQVVRAAGAVLVIAASVGAA